MVNEILYTRGAMSYWTVPGVIYRGKKLLPVDVLHGLLPAMTIDQGIALARGAKPKEFRPTSTQFNYSVFRAASVAVDNEAKTGLQEFLQSSMRSNAILTLTDTDYMPSKIDEVTHFDIVSKKPYSQNVRVVGPDCFVGNKEVVVLEAIVGTGDVNEVNAVSNWINKTNAYIWRLNNTPSKHEKRVTRFIADLDKLGLGCAGHPERSDPSFGYA